MPLEQNFLDQPISERRSEDLKVNFTTFVHHGKYDVYMGEQRLAEEGVRAEMMDLIRTRASTALEDGALLQGVRGIEQVTILDAQSHRLSQQGIADTGVNIAPQHRTADNLIYAPGRGLYLGQDFTASPILAADIVSLVRKYLFATGTYGKRLRAISVASPRGKNKSYSAELVYDGENSERVYTFRLHKPQVEGITPEIDSGPSAYYLSMFVHGPLISKKEGVDPRELPLILRLSGSHITTNAITSIAMNAGVMTPFAMFFKDDYPYQKLKGYFNAYPFLDTGHSPNVEDLLDHFRSCHEQMLVNHDIFSEEGMKTSGFGIMDLRQDEPISYQGHMSDKGTFIGVDSNTFDVAIHPLTSMIRATW